MPCEITKQNSTCGTIMPCVQIDIRNFDFIFTMLSVHHTFDGIFFYFKVMGNVNMVRLWDEKMAQHG
jgi:hypothetical protein